MLPLIGYHRLYRAKACVIDCSGMQENGKYIGLRRRDKGFSIKLRFPLYGQA